MHTTLGADVSQSSSSQQRLVRVLHHMCPMVPNTCLAVGPVSASAGAAPQAPKSQLESKVIRLV